MDIGPAWVRINPRFALGEKILFHYRIMPRLTASIIHTQSRPLNRYCAAKSAAHGRQRDAATQAQGLEYAMHEYWGRSE